MKCMVVISALVACVAAQVPYPGFVGGPYATAYHSRAYAPNFAYSGFGAPDATAKAASALGPVRTALDVFQPNVYNFHPYANLYANNNFYGYNRGFNYGYNYGYNPYAFAAAAPIAPATTVAAAAPAPAPAAVAVEALSPVVKAIDAPAGEVIAVGDDEDATIVAVDASAPVAPLLPAGPFHIRQIFPIFASDLRGGSDEIVFARPDQIVPVKPAVIKEDSEELPAVIAPDFGRSFVSAPAAPAGIVQATQPRFFVPPSHLANPVFTL